MNDTIQALILKQRDYREADVILTVLTEEYGKLSIVAAGARRMKSKNAGSILPHTLAELQIDYREDRTMFRLKSARSRKLFRHLHEDLVLSAASSVIADTADILTDANDETGVSETFQLVLQGLTALDEGKDPDTVLSLFLADILKMHGLEPGVDGCVHCGKQNVTALSAREGGFLCAEHALASGVPFADAVDLKRFRLLVKAGMEHLDIVLNAGGAKRSDPAVLAAILSQHGSVRLHSWTFYERLHN